MNTLLCCPNGHLWEAVISEKTTVEGQSLRCPECGRPAARPTDDATEAIVVPTKGHAAVPTFNPRNDNTPLPGHSGEQRRPARLADLTVGVGESSLGQEPEEEETAGVTPQLSNAVPGYLIEKELGRGGMGVVYKARQIQLNRVVALKMILAGGHASEEDLARFRTEAEAIARLQHPHIVQVYEVGEHEGKPYFSLEFCGGGCLDHRLDGTPMRSREAARLVEKLARAMHVAHLARVIHRDLKPANILLTEDGSPKITDFGLAKKLDAAGLTQSGTIMGTPSYMAPEQAEGRRDLGPGCDIYALGAILYDLITGRPPFRAATAMETVLQVLQEEPVAPSRLQSRTPRDLENICLKCLNKEPDRRYATALELAEDLARFQTGETVQARPVSAAERGWRWCRRNPLPASLLTLVVFSLVIGTGVACTLAAVALRQARRADKEASNARQAQEVAETNASQAKKERDRAEEEKVEKEKQLRLAEWLVYFNRMTLANGEWQHGSAARAWDNLEATEKNLRGWEYRYLANRFTRNTLPEANQVLTKLGPVLTVAVTADGRRIVSGGEDGLIRIWDADRGEQVCEFDSQHGTVQSLALSVDGRRILSGGSDWNVKIWDADKCVLLRTLKGHQGSVDSVAFSLDGNRIASGSMDAMVKVWDAESGGELFTLQGLTGWLSSVAFSPDGKRIVSGSQYQTIKVWDAVKGTEQLELKGHEAGVCSVAFSGDGSSIVSGSQDGTVKIWDADKGEARHTLLGHQGTVWSVAFSKDGRRLVSGGDDNTVRVWDAKRGRQEHELKGHRDVVRSVALSADGRRVVSGSLDKSLKVWNPDQDGEALVLRDHNGPVEALAVSAGTDLMASGGEEGTIKVWNRATGREIGTLTGHDGVVRAVAMSRSGEWIVSGGQDGSLKVWDVRRGLALRTLLGHTEAVLAVDLSVDGRLIASGSQDGTVKIWDRSKGEVLHTLYGHTNAVTSVSFRGDGQQVVSGSGDHHLKIWEVASGKELATLPGHDSWVTSVCFSADGKWIVSGSTDRTLKLWDADQEKELLALKGHIGSVLTVALSPDNKRILSGSEDGSVKLWDTQSGSEMLSLSGHSLLVNSVAWSGDGEQIISGSADHTIRIRAANVSSFRSAGPLTSAKRD